MLVVGRKTEGKRLRNKLKQLNVKLLKMRTEGARAMVAYLRRHLRGHIQYYGVSAIKAINTGIFLVMVSYSAFGDTKVWRLDLATESQKLGPEDFVAWIAQ